MSNPLKLVTAKELAKILNVPVSWIYQRTCQGSDAIPFIKFGKYVRFNPEEVIRHFKITQEIDDSRLEELQKTRQKKLTDLDRPVAYDVASKLYDDIQKHGSMQFAIDKAEEEYIRAHPNTHFD